MVVGDSVVDDGSVACLCARGRVYSNHWARGTKQVPAIERRTNALNLLGEERDCRANNCRRRQHICGTKSMNINEDGRDDDCSRWRIDFDEMPLLVCAFPNVTKTQTSLTSHQSRCSTEASPQGCSPTNGAPFRAKSGASSYRCYAYSPLALMVHTVLHHGKNHWRTYHA